MPIGTGVSTAPPTPTVHLGLNGVATDSSGNGYDFTATNITWDTTNYKLGTSSASFNGSSSKLTRATTAALKPLTGEFYVAFWMRSTATGTAMRITDLLGTDGTRYSINISTDSSNKVLYDAASLVITSTTSVLTGGGTWFHVIVQRTASQMELYVNNTLEANSSAAFWDVTKDGAGTHTIGAYLSAGAWYSGNLQDVRFGVGSSLDSASRALVYNGGSGTLL